MAVATHSAPRAVSTMLSSPVQRLGEQVFDAVAEVGGAAQFAGRTHGLAVEAAAEVGDAGPEFLHDRRFERAGGGDHRDVHRHGAGGTGA